MKRIYCEYEHHVIVEESGAFGIETKSGYLLLPMKYDRIVAASGIRNGVGFILCKRGKFGYVEYGVQQRSKAYGESAPVGCATAFLPCAYDWITPTRNGLAISASKDAGNDLWYDYKSRTLYRDVRYQETLGDFDVLIDFSRGACIPEIKKAGADEWVRFPKDCGIDILGQVHTDLCGVTFVLCQEEIPAPDSDTVDGCEYSFLLLYKNGWTPTPAKGTLTELYADLQAVIDGIAKPKSIADKENSHAYSLLCQYERRNEEWN